MRDIVVALVSPSRRFLSDPSMAEPLGLMYVEGVLLELGVKVEMVDMSFDTTLPEADIYGFSASTIQYPEAVEYARSVGGAYTIIGGPHASALPAEANRDFDAVVVGAGEKAVVKVLQDFRGKRKGGIFREPMRDLSSVPIPPRTILGRLRYNVFGKTPRSATAITSRGCPYNCAFCSSRTVWGRGVVDHSIEWVTREIAYLRERYGVRRIKFVDDTLTLNKPRLRLLAKALLPLDVRWFCEVRADTLDDEILDLMIEAGCTSVDIGVESVDDTVLLNISKKEDSDTMKRAIVKAKSRGLKVKLYLISGLPFEPRNIVQKTIDFIEETDPDAVSVFTLVPYPGTDIWNNPDKYNIKKITTDFPAYLHSIGDSEEERARLPNVEYCDRSREQIRDERNALKKFALAWNQAKSPSRDKTQRVPL